MYVLKDEVKALYIAMVRGDVALAQAIDNRTVASADDRKAFAYAFSLPFWATMPHVLDDEGFYSLLDFVAEMDQIVAPESMFDRLCSTYKLAVQNAVKKDAASVRKQ